MRQNRIQSPQGVKELMQELWLKYQSGDKLETGRIFWVDLPEPTEEEKRIMAENRANHKPVIIEENTLQSMLYAASEKLGGW